LPWRYFLLELLVEQDQVKQLLHII
jgi:hypothetical protein